MKLKYFSSTGTQIKHFCPLRFKRAKEIPRNGGKQMQSKIHDTDTYDEELIELLGTISVVSNRLATNLSKLARQSKSKEGGKYYEQNERPVSCSRRTEKMW
ncbi:hypothetical protein LQZ18_02645 [Lachnospiraceae bacterium ZAX-1]